MASRAENLAQLRRMFHERVRHELLAAVALGSVAKVDWQDAVDCYTDAVEDEVASMTAGLTQTLGERS